MNNNIKNNISYILDVSIKNKGKFYAGVFSHCCQQLCHC